VTPEARVGGPIALVKDGDKIVIDSASKTIQWSVSADEQAERRKAWEASGKKEFTVKRGVLFRYARDVSVSMPLRLYELLTILFCSLRSLGPTAISPCTITILVSMRCWNCIEASVLIPVSRPIITKNMRYCVLIAKEISILLYP
jgi:hypothetical protein